jgi:nucleoside phosphorylase
LRLYIFLNQVAILNITEKSYEELQEIIPQINLLLVTANDIETYHVRQAISPMPGATEVIKVPHGNHTYFLGTFGQYQCIHVQCGNMGSMNAGGAILTVDWSIDQWQPKVVLMIGVAMGANEEKQRIGDVLISETIISYENQRLSQDKIEWRSTIASPGNVLLNRFKTVTEWQCPLPDDKIAASICGPILSGEKLIDNLELRNEILKNFPSAVGAEMEGAGVYAACKSRNIPEWILVKGICDYGDGNKNKNKKERQNLAAQCATSLALKVFESRIGLKAAGLTPIAAEVAAQPEQIKHVAAESTEKEILAIIEPSPKIDKMSSYIQSTVSAFLELSSYQKAIIINDMGIDLASLTNLSAHEMDREFFKQVKEKNMLSQLWNSIDKIKPFTDRKNPFS